MSVRWTCVSTPYRCQSGRIWGVERCLWDRMENERKMVAQAGDRPSQQQEQCVACCALLLLHDEWLWLGQTNGQMDSEQRTNMLTGGLGLLLSTRCVCVMRKRSELARAQGENNNSSCPGRICPIYAYVLHTHAILVYKSVSDLFLRLSYFYFGKWNWRQINWNCVQIYKLIQECLCQILGHLDLTSPSVSQKWNHSCALRRMP